MRAGEGRALEALALHLRTLVLSILWLQSQRVRTTGGFHAAEKYGREKSPAYAYEASTAVRLILHARHILYPYTQWAREHREHAMQPTHHDARQGMA